MTLDKKFSRLLVITFVVTGIIASGDEALSQLIPSISTSTNAGVDVDATTTNTVIEGEINVSRTSIDTTGGVMNVSAQSVSSGEELEAYAKSAILDDEGLEEAKFTEDSVEVRYKQKGYLLAIMPMTFNVRAVARADGTSEVRYPWYSFLVMDNSFETETQLRVAVDKVLSSRRASTEEGEANRAFSPKESALVASSMQAILRANLERQNQAVVE